MPRHRLLLLAAFILLEALPASETSAPTIRFRQDSVCAPTTVPAAKILQGVRSQQTCSVECAMRSDCAVFDFSSSSGECRMGSTEDLVTSWTPPPASSTSGCISLLNSRLPGVLSFRSSLLAYLDFRIGRTNLVNSARFGVSGSSTGVTFDSTGAVFQRPGSEPNYVELKTVGGIEDISATRLSVRVRRREPELTGNVPIRNASELTEIGRNRDIISTATRGAAFGDLLGRGRNFSVYARVSRMANQTQMYYLMTNCSDYGSLSGAFGYFNSRQVMTHGLTGPDELKFRASNETLSEVTGQTVSVSVGSVFDGNKFSATYYNGRMLDVQDFTFSELPTFSGKPECIRLGYHPDPQLCLAGRYVCFALIAKALSADEFAEIDALCA